MPSDLCIKPRIPLKHIDKINSSVKNLTKIELNIQNNLKPSTALFKVSGECPVYISSINSSDERLKNIDLKLGDYVMNVNGQNVCRASAKTVNKLVKSSNTLTMILCRPNESKVEPKNQQNISIVEQTIIKPQIGFKSLISCFNRKFVPKVKKVDEDKKQELEQKIEEFLPMASDDMVSTSQDETIDYGYYSIPTTGSSSSQINALSSCPSVSSFNSSSSTYSKYESKNPINTDSIKSKIELFLTDMQILIDTYVRPAAMLKIISVEQSLDLFQNIEKLIPISKFMLNIVNSYEQNCRKLPQAELLKLVFDSFKTYLNGLPRSMSLLGELAASSNKFMGFLEDLNDTDTFKIFDYLFMPLKFVQFLIDFMQSIQKASIQSEDDLNSENNQKLKQIIMDLYQCSINTHMLIKNNVDYSYSINKTSSITNVSTFSYGSYSASSIYEENSEERIPIEINDNPDSNSWKKATLIISANNKLNIECQEAGYHLNLTDVINAKKSAHCNIVYFKMIQSSNSVAKQIKENASILCIAVKLETDELKNYLFNAVIKDYF